MGHKKPFQFIAQALNVSDCLNLSPMQPWMSPWRSQPPTSPPLRHCSSGTHRCRRWRAMSSSSPATQVRCGSISAHLYLFSSEGQQLVHRRAVPHPQTPAPPLQVPWQVLSTAPSKPLSMVVPTARDWDPSALLTGPQAAAQGQASTHPTETWCVVNSVKPTSEGK